MDALPLSAARWLSILVVVLMAFASAAGLLLDPLYRDNLLVSSGWRGNDLVTLFVATPLLAGAIARAGDGSPRAALVWVGLLDYALYNYAFYVFGAAFNGLFLVYVAIVTLALFALVAALVGLDAASIGRRFDGGTPVRGVAVFLGMLALGLGGFHVAVSAAYLFTGVVPPIVAATGHPTHVVAALDLSLVVSVSALGTVWLWRGQPWGYVTAAVTTVKGAVYMLALSAATVAAVRAGATGDLSPVGLWAAIGIGCLVSAWALLAHLER
jgi:hypothetical protein